MQANRASDSLHIDYVIPMNDPERLRNYSNFIARECLLRGIKLIGSQVEEWRTALRMSVAMEQYISFLEKGRAWSNNGHETVPLVEVVELLIPCILHLENRIAEKIVTIILRKGLDNYPGQKEAYIGIIQDVFRKQILGTEECPSQWRVYHDKDSNGNITIDPVSFRNNVGRSILSKIDVLLEATIQRESDRATLVIALTKYREAMALLTVHRELTEEEVDMFQDLVDDFFEKWLQIFGHEGVTNYIHLLSSGHINYFMKKYGCLYLYSQQGWEALNSTIQTFILQSSQRGGHNSGENKSKSYVFPLVRFIIRDLLWKTGEADRFFIELEESGKKC
jgi:hypothetical protein